MSNDTSSSSDNEISHSKHNEIILDKNPEPSFDDSPSIQESPEPFELPDIPKRPDWVPDSQQQKCYICSKEFSLLVRKHHCRACGNICCADCSHGKMNLEHLGYMGPQRACSKCLKKSKKTKKRRDRRVTMSNPVLSSQMVLTDILGRPLRKFFFSLTPNSFRWYKHAEEQLAAFYVYLGDILTVAKPSDLEFIVHAYPQYERENGTIREKLLIRVRCDSTEQRNQWVSEILSRLNPEQNEQQTRRLLILINPFGGRKLAPTIWKQVEPMFRLASIELSIRYTEHEGHGIELAEKLDLGVFDGIVCVSGDGLVHEVINGLMRREDREEAMKIPVGTIAGGSGNALAAALGNLDPTTAAFSIIKGTVRRMDLLQVVQEGQKDLYSFLSVNWGLISDVDFESEKYRFLGGARFTVGALVRITNLRTYHAKLEFIRAPLSLTSFCTLTKSCKDCKLSHDTNNHAPEGEWEVLEGEFITITGCNIQKLSYDFHAAPFAHLADGTIDLLIISKCTRSQLLNLFTMMETGKFVNSAAFNLGSFTQYLKVTKYKLSTRGSSYGFDGERAHSQKDITVTNLCGVANILG